jgi:hypothetical protein
MEIHCAGIRRLLIVAASLRGGHHAGEGQEDKTEVVDGAEPAQHSERETPIKVISRGMERTVGALRQQAFRMGIPIGERSADH